MSCLPSFAALGEDVASVQADQAHINASLRVSQTSSYAVHELRTPTGIVVREFASPAGRIFAISWKGPSIPDLRQLLGSHFADFQQAAQAQNSQGRHGPLFVQQNGMTVELGGHMRDHIGRAYLPDQLPAGVHAEDLR